MSDENNTPIIPPDELEPEEEVATQRDYDSESILDTVKKMLGVQHNYEHFDSELILHINSVFMVLNQLGLGPSAGFFIADYTSKWNQFLDYSTNFEAVKNYTYLRVRILFDPPSSSFVLDAMERQIKEFEWRLKLQMERKEEDMDE